MDSFADGTDAMIVTSNICLFSVRKIVTNSRDRHVVSRRRRSQRLYKSGSAAIQGGDESPHSKENTLCRTPQSVLLVHFLSSRFDRGGFSFSGTLPCVARTATFASGGRNLECGDSSPLWIAAKPPLFYPHGDGRSPSKPYHPALD